MGEGLCSVCYKDAIKKKQQPPTGMPASLAPAPGTMASLSIDESSVASSESSCPAKYSSVDTALPTVILPSSQTDKRNESEVEGMAVAGASSSFVGDDSTVASDSPIATNPDDDGHKEGGKKKVGLTGFTCRCGGLFCSIHRYSDKHDCTFDY